MHVRKFKQDPECNAERLHEGLGALLGAQKEDDDE